MSMYFKISDAWNTPNLDGLTCKRSFGGKLRMYYDAKNVLIAAYSYNTCILATMPDGRHVVNITHYSNTTIKHQYAVFGAVGYSRWREPSKPVCEANDVRQGAREQHLIAHVIDRGYQLAS